jgi:hypothetical protein
MMFFNCVTLSLEVSTLVHRPREIEMQKRLFLYIADLLPQFYLTRAMDKW